MTRFSVCYLALVALSVVVKEACADAPERIVGGTVADVGEFPYQVSLRKRNSHFCGGSIISSLHILTAAHCVSELTLPNYFFTIVTGTNSLETGGEVHNAKAIRLHPEYTGNHDESWVNDIAVILLEEPIKFNKLQKPIEVFNGKLPSNAHLRLSGWGRIYKDGPLSNALLKADLHLQDQSTCQKQHGETIYSSHICAINKAGIGACHGDSGGPLVYSGLLVGIASWVVPCASGRSDIFTSIPSHINFIENAMQTF